MTARWRSRSGQHFLRSRAVAERVADAAGIRSSDTVLEAGTGRGALTRVLCSRAARVVSIEADARLFDACAALGEIANLRLEHGDAFAGDGGRFDVFVSSLPYSESRRAIEWMAQRTFRSGALVVQKEFAQKLMPRRASERRAVSVIASESFEIEHVAGVARRDFDPPPHVDSVIVSLRRRRTLGAATVRALNGLFSYRRKALRGVLRCAGGGSDARGSARIDELDGAELVRIAEGAARS